MPGWSGLRHCNFGRPPGTLISDVTVNKNITSRRESKWARLADKHCNAQLSLSVDEWGWPFDLTNFLWLSDLKFLLRGSVSGDFAGRELQLLRIIGCTIRHTSKIMCYCLSQRTSPPFPPTISPPSACYNGKKGALCFGKSTAFPGEHTVETCTIPCNHHIWPTASA